MILAIVTGARLTSRDQVPQGHCWIVGDNLAASRDSRQFGPVPLALIRGKVIGRIKPFRFQWIVNPLQQVEEHSKLNV